MDAANNGFFVFVSVADDNGISAFERMKYY